MTKKIAWFTSTRGVYHWSFEGDWSPKAAMATLESRNSFLLVSYLCPDHTSLCLTSIQGYLYKNSVRSSPTVLCDETQCTYVWLVADWQLCLTLIYMGGAPSASVWKLIGVDGIKFFWSDNVIFTLTLSNTHVIEWQKSWWACSDNTFSLRQTTIMFTYVEFYTQQLEGAILKSI